MEGRRSGERVPETRGTNRVKFCRYKTRGRQHTALVVTGMLAPNIAAYSPVSKRPRYRRQNGISHSWIGPASRPFAPNVLSDIHYSIKMCDVPPPKTSI
ncbi:hypothetical protein E2C01_017801 [Portunus trituberculatus]|uniref:Uncharacterized protein n=1 Tax=Portunus trituberculatus TaxID=210409 RepID=A0A5B7DSS2_PORTR|nr:hypothetical protein [Portunus trituberculatus]